MSNEKRISLLLISIIVALAVGAVSVFADVEINVDGDCSLANAIRSANGEPQLAEAGDADGNDDCEIGTLPDTDADPPEDGADTINLSASVVLTAELPAITSPISINGNGKRISSGGSIGGFSVMYTDLSISQLVLTQLSRQTEGGAIAIVGGSLTLEDSVVSNSSAGNIGGGIYSSDSDVTLTRSRLRSNSTVQSHGGGLYFISSDSSNTLHIEESVFLENIAEEDGGAIKASGGTIEIIKSTFQGNIADEGGAIEASNTVMNIVNSTFTGNRAREGGGLSSFGSTVTLTHTTWAHNYASEQGGGIAVIGWDGAFMIRNTLITDSEHGGDCHPGPNYENIIQEFTGNFIQDGTCMPPPPPAEDQSLDSQTLDGAAQSADDDSDADSDDADADDAEATEDGDADADAEATEDSDDSAAASSASDEDLGDLEAQHMPMESESPSLGNAMINPVTGTTLPHHPLQWGSPAIDGGDPAYCNVAGVTETDQIGTVRPQYDNCDIGAWEYPKPPPPPPQPDDPEPTQPPPSVPVPTVTPENDPCIPSDFVIVRSNDPELRCANIDILNIDKHPELDGIRAAVQVWRGELQCVHYVQPGDNLYRIAMQYDTTAETLIRHNALESSEIHSGQQIILPTCPGQAVSLAADTEVCFALPGRLVFVDTASPERAVIQLNTYQEDGYFCARIDRSGMVVLIGG